MPTAEKRGKRHRGIAFHEGRKIPAGTHDTKGAALAAAAEIERKAKLGIAVGGSGKILRDLFERYADEVSPTKSTKKWEQTRLAFYGRDPIADVPLSELTPDHFGKLRDRRMQPPAGSKLKPIASSTLLRDFAIFSAALKLAKNEWRWITENPMSSVRRPKDQPARTRRLQAKELEALQLASGYNPKVAPKTATARTIAAFEFSVETAIRGGEILALRKNHCHEKHVHVIAGKTDEARDVPLSKRAREILGQVMSLKLDPVFGLLTAHKDALFRKMRKRAGIKGLNFHDARREGTTRLSKIYDVLELSRITGHRDLSILRNVYYRPSIDDLTKKME